MDIATIGGFIFGAVCIVVSILLDGSLRSFYNVPSIFITLGGGIASIMISYRLSELARIPKLIGKAFFSKQSSPEETIKLLVDLSQKARREGLLALESEQEKLEDKIGRASCRERV